ncbi:unnamed protein product, partial [Protopolystoma xenopodis]
GSSVQQQRFQSSCRHHHNQPSQHPPIILSGEYIHHRNDLVGKLSRERLRFAQLQAEFTRQLWDTWAHIEATRTLSGDVLDTSITTAEATVSSAVPSEVLASLGFKKTMSEFTTAVHLPKEKMLS